MLLNIPFSTKIGRCNLNHFQSLYININGSENKLNKHYDIMQHNRLKLLRRLLIILAVIRLYIYPHAATSLTLNSLWYNTNPCLPTESTIQGILQINGIKISQQN